MARGEGKQEKRKGRKKRKIKDDCHPKQEQKTIDSMRVPDETIVDPQNEDVLDEQRGDEFSSYFGCERPPKVLITTNPQGRSYVTWLFGKELEAIIPDSKFYKRGHIELKKLVSQASERGYTDIIVINEDRKKANSIVLIHLPDGPTAWFRLSSVRLGKNIRGHGRTTSHKPELILNNFCTQLGQRVGRMLASVFPYDPEFKGRRVVTFHNQRDFVFFRHHRYIFKDSERVGLQEIGPRFTLKLRRLQNSAFDPKYGEYEWFYKRKVMETSRRKFFL